MKNLIILSFLIVVICCKPKTIAIVPQLVADFEIKQDGFIVDILDKTQNVTSYNIDFGDGTKTNEEVLENSRDLGKHIYKKNGLYIITLTVYDAKKESKKSTKQVSIIGADEVTATADFSYQILEDGVVKFTNLSKHAQSYSWRVNGEVHNSEEINPTFVFELNGEYEIFLYARSFYPSEKSIKINISNAKGRQLATFNGQFFSEKFNLIEQQQKVRGYSKFLNSYNESFIESGISNTQIGISATYFLNLVNLSTEQKYIKLREYLTIGKKIINPKIGDYWNLTLYNSADIGKPKLLSEASNAQLEIIEVQEVPQPKLIPEMYDKAFWVTFKIKADFGNGNNIDGTLKVRYLIY